MARTYAWPTVHGAIISNDGPCNLAAAKTDAEILACGQTCLDSRKVIRTWTVLDWCSGETVNFVQIIKATDNKPPTVIANDLTVSTDPWGCTANVSFPDPVTLQRQLLIYSWLQSRGGPLGTQIIYHQASKAGWHLNVPKGDHNFITKPLTAATIPKSIDTITVSVRDLTSPVAISKEFVVVSLTNGGDGKGMQKSMQPALTMVHTMVNTGVKLELRRDEDVCGFKGNDTYNADGHSHDRSSDPNHDDYDPDNGAFVKFCCADLTGVENGGTIRKCKSMVACMGWRRHEWCFGSAGDNYNETWSYVRVEDTSLHLPCTVRKTLRWSVIRIIKTSISQAGLPPFILAQQGSRIFRQYKPYQLWIRDQYAENGG